MKGLALAIAQRAAQKLHNSAVIPLQRTIRTTDSCAHGGISAHYHQCGPMVKVIAHTSSSSTIQTYVQRSRFTHITCKWWHNRVTAPDKYTRTSTHRYLLGARSATRTWASFPSAILSQEFCTFLVPVQCCTFVLRAMLDPSPVLLAFSWFHLDQI